MENNYYVTAEVNHPEDGDTFMVFSRCASPGFECAYSCPDEGEAHAVADQMERDWLRARVSIGEDISPYANNH